jgi:PAS domain S-box-containing protein
MEEVPRRLAAILEATPDVIATFDAHENLIFVNKAARNVWGLDEGADLTAWNVRRGHPQWAYELIHDVGFPAAIREGIWHGEAALLQADGREIPVSQVILCRRGEDGAVEEFSTICRDITDLKQAELRLQTLNDTLERRVVERTEVAEQRASQLRALAAELTQAEQRERRRLAQILHDHLQQLLVAAKLNVGLLRGRTKDAELLESLQQSDDLLKDAIAASRSLAVELSPPILYEGGGLSAALEWLTRWMFDKHGLTVDLQVEAAAEPSAEEMRVLLFEAVRELLFNVVKHSKTNRARVRMAPLSDTQLEIVVSDAGVGFDPQAVEAALPGFGLSNFRQRLELLGARLEIDSAPEHGARMRLVAPLRRAGEMAGTGLELDGASEGRPPTAVHSRRRKRLRADGKIRTLLVDDQRILRAGLARLLQDQPDIEIVGEASDGQMAVQLARELQPHVIIMDITMPKLNGIEATRLIMNEHPEIRVIGLSLHEEEDMARAILNAGAAAYLTKGGPTEDLIRAIHSASRKT